MTAQPRARAPTAHRPPHTAEADHVLARAHLCQGRLQLLVAKGLLLGEHRQGRRRASGAVHRAVAARGGHARHVEAHAHAGLRAEGDHARGVARAVARAAVGGAAAAALVRGHRRAEGGLLLRLCEVDGAPAQHGRPLLLVETGGGGPRRGEHGRRGAALLGRDREQLVDERDGLGGERARPRVELEDGLREGAARTHRLLHARVPPVLRRGLVEGEEAGEHREEADAQAPHVREPAVVAEPGEHLRRTVALAAADLLERNTHHRAARVEIVRMRQPKVAQLARVAVAEQHVLELEVAMHDALLVEVAHCAHHLAEVTRGSLLLQLALRDHETEKLTPLRQLHEDEYLVELSHLLRTA
mmetsp:Transcript_35884/g.90951  ORF Transcript_35884/g.90951 Transcript_35884/m.90951 type:complete len:358 (-) Transcript_35884:262-1335(-)